MSDEEKSTSETAAGTAPANEVPVEQPVDDEHTTAPNPPQHEAPAAPPKWEMPKPVFKQTSGYLPQGYLKEVQDAAGASPDSENTTQEQRPMVPEKPAGGPDLSSVNLLSPPAAAAVEPQPDLSEQLIPEEPVLEAVQEPPKKGGVRASMVVLGLVAFLAFVAIFLTVVYYLFLKGPGDTNNF